MPRHSRFPRFRPLRKRQRSGAKSSNWRLWRRITTFALVVIGIWWFLVKPLTHEQGWTSAPSAFALCGEGVRQQACVIDGDTVHIGFGADRRRIRLTGYDAPEIEGACEAESALALSARARLHQWLNEGPFEWDGADSPPRDQYGRELREARRLASDGSQERLADVMIAQGLASTNAWGEGPRDWCAP